MSHAFQTEVLRERVLLLRALGERELALALEAHLQTVRRVLKAKRLLGYSTHEAWTMYLEESRAEPRRQLARAALERKKQLGWMRAPGVPGPYAARRPSEANPYGVAWVPLPGPAPLPRDGAEGEPEQPEAAEGAAAAVEPGPQAVNGRRAAGGVGAQGSAGGAPAGGQRQEQAFERREERPTELDAEQEQLVAGQASVAAFEASEAPPYAAASEQRPLVVQVQARGRSGAGGRTSRGTS